MIKSNSSILTIFFHGDDFFEKWFIIDDFMIRQTDMDIYSVEQKNGVEIITKNNQKLIVTVDGIK